MWKMVLIGISLMQTSPGVRHPSQIEIAHIATQAECENALSTVVQALRDNLGTYVTIRVASCRKE